MDLIELTLIPMCRFGESQVSNSTEIMLLCVSTVVKTKIPSACLRLSVNWCEEEGKPICEICYVGGINSEVEGSGEAGNAAGFAVPNVDRGGVEGATKRPRFRQPW